MKKTLFKCQDTMYKANLHCHTTLSDGKCTPEQIKENYKAKGYSIVAFTDHRVLKAQSHLNDDGFLALNALEVDISQEAEGAPWSGRKTYHFNLYATSPEMISTPLLPQMRYEDLDAMNQYIQDRCDEGFLVCYNHPYWSLQTYADYSGLKGLFAMEIYNHGCEVEGCYGYHPQSYDEMLRACGPLYCLSTDDNHNRHAPDSSLWDSFGGFTMIGCGKLGYGEVIDALKRGDFYSSQGPEIYEISLEDNKLSVKCSEASTITVFTDGRKCYVQRGEGMKEASFEISGQEGYVRVMVRDKDYKDANSNAYWL